MYINPKNKLCVPDQLYKQARIDIAREGGFARGRKLKKLENDGLLPPSARKGPPRKPARCSRCGMMAESTREARTHCRKISTKVIAIYKRRIKRMEVTEK